MVGSLLRFSLCILENTITGEKMVNEVTQSGMERTRALPYPSSALLRKPSSATPRLAVDPDATGMKLYLTN